MQQHFALERIEWPTFGICCVVRWPLRMVTYTAARLLCSTFLKDHWCWCVASVCADMSACDLLTNAQSRYESIFECFDITSCAAELNELSSEHLNFDSMTILNVVETFLYHKVGTLQQRLCDGSIVVKELQHEIVDLEHRDVLHHIGSLEPWTVYWSNVFDYYTRIGTIVFLLLCVDVPT
jgi:hypothetical protein